MADEENWITVTFLDVTGAKQLKAQIDPDTPFKEILPSVITRMGQPMQSPDGNPMSYALDHKEGGKRLQNDQTPRDAGIKDGDHLIVNPEVVAG